MTAHAQQSDTASIPVPGGTFEFTGLKITGWPSYALKGYVTNKTGRDWKWAVFEMTFWDEKGQSIPVAMELQRSLRSTEFRAGETKEILGVSVFVTYKSKAKSVTFKFVMGDFAVEYKTALMKPEGSKDNAFEDDAVKIHWLVTAKALNFRLWNKTESPIKIDWNQVSYVDPSSTAQKVMHEGVKYINRNESQPPTIIPPLAKIDDFIFPSANASYSSGRYGGWSETPIFPAGEEGASYKGKTFSVFMPLEINGTVKSYSFVFKIQDVVPGKL